MNNELRHYGVLGMRWGTRRNRGNSDHQTLRSTQRKKIKDMSDDELQKANERLSLIKGYKEARFPKGKRAKDMSNAELRTFIKKAQLYKAQLRRHYQLFSFKKISDINKMTSEEVDNALRRVQLEQRYLDLRISEFSELTDTVNFVFS